MKFMTKCLLFSVIILLVGLLAIFFLRTTQFAESTSVLLLKSACHDGCSYATKGDDGFLNNNTWECWDYCDEYVDSLMQEEQNK